MATEKPRQNPHEERFNRIAATNPGACPKQTIEAIERDAGIVWGAPCAPPRFDERNPEPPELGF